MNSNSKESMGSQITIVHKKAMDASFQWEENEDHQLQKLTLRGGGKISSLSSWRTSLSGVWEQFATATFLRRAVQAGEEICFCEIYNRGIAGCAISMLDGNQFQGKKISVTEKGVDKVKKRSMGEGRR